MACMYCDRNGVCTLFDLDLGVGPDGCENDGYCMVDYEPYPYDLCDSFVSDDDDYYDDM